MDKGEDLIGMPFKYGARGPHEFDCYGLVMEMSRRNGQPVPEFGFSENQAVIAGMFGSLLPQWEEIPQRPGATALIRVGRYVAHCGYLIEPSLMVHTWEMSGGVTVQRVDEWQHRIVGFYKYVGC